MTSSRENILIKRPDIVHNWRSGKSSSTLNRATKSSKAIVFSTHWNLVNMPCLVQPSFYSPHNLRWISSLNEKHTKFHGRCRCLSLHHFQRLLGRFFNDLSSAKLSSFFWDVLGVSGPLWMGDSVLGTSPYHGGYKPASFLVCTGLNGWICTIGYCWLVAGGLLMLRTKSLGWKLKNKM